LDTKKTPRTAKERGRIDYLFLFNGREKKETKRERDRSNDKEEKSYAASLIESKQH
jgi:hypothetical protein